MCACEKVFIIYFWENLRWNLKVAPSNKEKTTCKSARYWKGELQVELHGLYPSCRIYQGSLGEVLNSKEGTQETSELLPTCCSAGGGPHKTQNKNLHCHTPESSLAW